MAPEIPQKWLRVPVDLGEFRIDLSLSAAEIDRDLATFNAEMMRRIEAIIDAWQADNDPTVGGLLWGFPGGRGTQSRTITPADVVGWDQSLAGLRMNRRVARPTIIPVLEYENLEDPLHPDERTVRIILANESDLLDAKLALARETDSTLYQVEMSVAFDPGVHRPIRLDRIAPSYRYNRYLAHDALGINCGVRRRGLTDATVLETTSLPVYYQPLIRQFDLPTPPNFDVLGSNDGGLGIVRGLLSAFDDWLRDVEASQPYARSLDPVADASDYAREIAEYILNLIRMKFGFYHMDDVRVGNGFVWEPGLRSIVPIKQRATRSSELPDLNKSISRRNRPGGGFSPLYGKKNSTLRTAEAEQPA
jgi:hypothetical protein